MDVIRHMEHVVEVAGPQAAAIGSDFDGTFMMPRGLEDATKIPRIAEALLKKGMPEAQVRGIMGENGVRVLKRLLSS
jgi:membrane dipeptidase